MATGTLSESFSAELDQIASNMANGPDASIVNLTRVATDQTMTPPTLASETQVETTPVLDTTTGALQRVRGAGMGKWLEGSTGYLDNLVAIGKGQVSNAIVVTPSLGVSGRNLSERDPELARDISTVRSVHGVTAVLRSLGYSEEDTKRFIEQQLPSAREEVYVTNEGGQVIVTGKVLDVPGKGSIHLQELAPQGYYMDSQVVFAPEGSVVRPQTSAA